MSDDQGRVEFPDEAGYPDGSGFLDEGTGGGDSETGASDAEGDEVEDFADADEEDDEPED